MPAVERANKRQITPQMESRKWKKGQSGNPSGRPKIDHSQRLAQHILELAAKHADPSKLAAALLKQLAKGNAKPFALLADRGYGKPAQSVTVDAEVKHLLISDL